ncbi:hypothetical protein M430DRAFT_33335 [Amorphotheca resinae ATCC 22711]|uniref:Transmembrane protein n=1 Tax=Amorphotheca resinae ATCC 22711 TaxID=857342 RepID=A0A2T3BBM9_AMORE|nr:hypothetical protein M430DRAFT_33335 [Amorphotheca resinae ATCC 22711]PSS25731.1 hypothetical protein M430DRAFT_33335 [Amorphotheca resinae ATCC 22711]
MVQGGPTSWDEDWKGGRESVGLAFGRREQEAVDGWNDWGGPSRDDCFSLKRRERSGSGRCLLLLGCVWVFVAVGFMDYGLWDYGRWGDGDMEIRRMRSGVGPEGSGLRLFVGGGERGFKRSSLRKQGRETRDTTQETRD